jgi:hypothetical protein
LLMQRRGSGHRLNPRRPYTPVALEDSYVPLSTSALHAAGHSVIA